MMIGSLVQLIITVVWASMVVVHTRRLLRLAHMPLPVLRQRVTREHLNRIWWWLGREEFWRNVQTDCLRCMQVTLMLFLFTWLLPI